MQESGLTFFVEVRHADRTLQFLMNFVHMLVPGSLRMQVPRKQSVACYASADDSVTNYD